MFLIIDRMNFLFLRAEGLRHFAHGWVLSVKINTRDYDKDPLRDNQPDLSVRNPRPWLQQPGQLLQTHHMRTKPIFLLDLSLPFCICYHNHQSQATPTRTIRSAALIEGDETERALEE